MNTLLDLFAGIGGFSLGMTRAGWWPVGFCEKDEFCQKILHKHWPAHRIYPDIYELTKEVLDRDGIKPRLITAGVPCQPYSYAGRRRGEEDDRALWSETLRVVWEVQPAWVVCENVVGFATLGLDAVLFDLESLGYSAGAFVVPSCAIDACHRRDRLWLIAHASRVRLEGSWRYLQPVDPAQNPYREASGLVDAVQRNALPFVCGRHDGVSKRLDVTRSRLKALGNSVLPQIPEIIGRAIMAVEQGEKL